MRDSPARLALGLVPAAAAVLAAVKDPPCDLLCTMLFAPARESDHPAAAENEGGRGRGMDENLRERESSARDCAPEFQWKKPLHMHSGALSESRVSEFVACFEAMVHTSSMSRSLPSGAFTKRISAGTRSTTEVTQSRAADKCTSSSPSTLVMCTSRGASTPPSASTGIAIGEQLPASDLELQKIGINLEAEFGGQVEEQSENIFIGSAEHKVLIPPPAPVLAYGECTVKLGGRIVDQQDFISNAGPRTFVELKDASICEPAYFSSIISCVPLCHLSVPSFVTASLGIALVSAIIWAGTITHLELFEVGDTAPNLIWAREGIGTRTWNELHRRGRVTTH
ncbi:hypothetical protein B0H14DRAFT_3566122 [Mycena olivaceomarginata]|nr:hypothetical protein B0H14DRAFT_3566122 [Mycena olivaceomarginata]